MPPKVGGGEMESRENQGTDTRSGIPSDENVPLWEPLFFPSFLLIPFRHPNFQEPEVFGVRVYLLISFRYFWYFNEFQL